MQNQNTTTEIAQMLNIHERVGSRIPELSMIKRATDMLLRAETTWPVIAEEEGGLKEAFLPYAVVVGFIPGLVGSVLSVALWGTIGALFGGAQAVSGMIGTIFGSVFHFAYGMFGMLVTAKIIEIIAPSFGLRKSWVLTVRALVYGSTPIYVASAIFWIPVLGWLVGFPSMIWSLLLMFRGLKALLAQPVESKKVEPVVPARERELANV